MVCGDEIPYRGSQEFRETLKRARVKEDAPIVCSNFQLVSAPREGDIVDEVHLLRAIVCKRADAVALRVERDEYSETLRWRKAAEKQLRIDRCRSTEGIYRENLPRALTGIVCPNRVEQMVPEHFVQSHRHRSRVYVPGADVVQAAHAICRL